MTKNQFIPTNNKIEKELCEILNLGFEKYYRAALSENIKRGLAARKQKLIHRKGI